MRKSWLLCFATGLVAGHVAAQAPGVADREEYLAYTVAAASAEGDLSSDAAMVSLLTLQEHIAAQPHETAAPATPRELVLRAEAEVLRNQLSARVDAALMDSPELLARDLGCWHKPATPEVCAARTQRLEALAGDNAFLHVELMGRAWKRGDAAKFLEHARAAAAAPHYRSLYSDAYDSVYRRLSQVPASESVDDDLKNMPGASQAGVMAMALAAAYAMPAFQHFAQPCREAEGELREHCLDIALMQLEAGSSTMEIINSASLVKALGDDPERQLADARLRDVHWMMQGMAELAQRDAKGLTSLGYAAYFEDYGRKGELVATLDLLQANGIAAQPPADWTPER